MNAAVTVALRRPSRPDPPGGTSTHQDPFVHLPFVILLGRGLAHREVAAPTGHSAHGRAVREMWAKTRCSRRRHPDLQTPQGTTLLSTDARVDRGAQRSSSGEGRNPTTAPRARRSTSRRTCAPPASLRTSSTQTLLLPPAWGAVSHGHGRTQASTHHPAAAVVELHPLHPPLAFALGGALQHGRRVVPEVRLAPVVVYDALRRQGG